MAPTEHLTVRFGFTTSFCPWTTQAIDNQQIPHGFVGIDGLEDGAA